MALALFGFVAIGIVGTCADHSSPRRATRANEDWGAPTERQREIQRQTRERQERQSRTPTPYVPSREGRPDAERYDHMPARFALNAPNTDAETKKRRFADHLEAALDNPCARNEHTYGLHFDRRAPRGWSLTGPDGSSMFGMYPVTWIFSAGLEGVSDGPDVLLVLLEDQAQGRSMVRWDVFFECS